MKKYCFHIFILLLLFCQSKPLTAQTIPTKLNKVGIQYSQSVRDSIGQEDGVLLNRIAAYLRIQFDFSHKKVAFYTGPGAGARSDKERYRYDNQAFEKTNPNSQGIILSKIYIFDSDEKEKANGYDAVIVFGSVKQFPSKETLVKRLHRSKKNNNTKMKLDELLKKELSKMGFNKKGYNFFCKINDNVYTTIGFTAASHQTKGSTLLNPVIGISYDDVNTVYDNLCGIRHVLAPTIWIPIGYLMPEKKYKEWELENDTDNTETLSDMLFTIRLYGIEYWHKMTDFNTLFDAVIARPIGLQEDRQNRLLPILYYMRGEKEKGQQVINAAIKDMQIVDPKYLKFAERYKALP